MKILPDEVVESCVRVMHLSILQSIALVYNKCANNFEQFLILDVSYLCMVTYLSTKHFM